MNADRTRTRARAAVDRPARTTSAAARSSVVDPHGTRAFGDAGRTHERRSSTPRSPCTTRASTNASSREGSVGLGESYADGWWDADDLTGVPPARAPRASAARTPRRDRVHRLAHARSSTRSPGCAGPTSSATRRNVRAHYDLGNDFFQRLLDETMMYSCAVFDAPGMSLADASRAKLDRLARLLDLAPDDRVLEIGTGWGGFAVHAAQRATAATSRRRRSRPRSTSSRTAPRRATAGLDDRVTVLDDDYRDLARHVRQGRRDRDDRSRRLARLRHVLRHAAARLLADDGAARRCRRSSCPTTSFDRLEAPHRLHQGRDLPRRLPARRSAALTDAAATAAASTLTRPSTTSACTTPRRCAAGAPTSTRRRAELAGARARRAVRPPVGLLLLATARPAFDERYIGDVQLRLRRAGVASDGASRARRATTAHRHDSRAALVQA